MGENMIYVLEIFENKNSEFVSSCFLPPTLPYLSGGLGGGNALEFLICEHL